LVFKIEFQESPKTQDNVGQGAQQAVNVPAGNQSPVGPKPRPDDYAARLLKYTPVELIVGFVIARATIPENAMVFRFPAVWILFLLFLALTPAYTGLILKIGFIQSALMALDFCVWVLAIGGPFTTFTWYRPLYGALALAIFTFVIPLINISHVSKGHIEQI
jgi:hypothetical protein